MSTEPLTEVTAEPESTDESNGATAGDVLQQERQRQGLSEKEVADQLHITMHYVRALESNCYEKLPGAVFAKGYLKSYALLLDLNVEDIMSRYDALEKQQKAENESDRQVIRTRKRRDRNKPLVILSLAVFVIGFLGLWFVNNYFSDEPVPAVSGSAESVDIAENSRSALSQGNEQQLSLPPQLTLQVEPEDMSTAVVAARLSTSVPSRIVDIELAPEQSREVVSESLVESESAAEAESGELEQSPSIEDLSATLEALREEQAVKAELIASASQSRLINIEASGSDILRISFTGESWVEVNDSDSQQVYRDIRVAGDILEIAGSAPFNILLGDAPFAQVSLNGNEIDLSSDIRIDNSARLTVGL